MNKKIIAVIALVLVLTIGLVACNGKTYKASGVADGNKYASSPVENNGSFVVKQGVFPVIKQFLYSDHEIFLREMVSNAVDATQKMKTLASAGDFSGDLGDLSVRVTLDEQAGTLTISDRGIGMTAEEIDKYINQIAFSGVTDFLDKYKDKAIIGHFGLGFYSAFMVSKKVEIVTKSWREGSHAVRWTCDGSPEYTIDEVEKADRGSDIILHIHKLLMSQYTPQG